MKKLGKKKTRQVVLFVIVGFVLLVAILFWVYVIGITASKTGKFYNKGTNAVWIAHEWAGTDKSDSEIENLVGKLVSHRINTVYLHVGPIGEDGSINSSVYKSALNFVEKAKKMDPDMKIFAWMGQLRNKLSLGSASVRHNILNMCTIFTEMMKMDGVQYDIEPVWDGDTEFIELLKETREMFDSREQGAKISVAMAEFIPGSLVWLASGFGGFENYNTEVNYTNVAAYADQIVTMVYDTGTDNEFYYKWLVKEQVIWISNLLDGMGVGSVVGDGTGVSAAARVRTRPEFYVAIPSYDKVGGGIGVENVQNGMLGVLNGLNDIRSSEENVTGVAIYPEWEISDDEWAVYDALWNQ